jgi:two-component system sensor histidine kinase BaeS
MTASSRRPHRRPSWWPENEQWPPDPAARRYWSRRAARGHAAVTAAGGGEHYAFRRPFGCLLVALLVFVIGLLTVGAWAIGAVVGFVPAHPVLRVVGVVAVALLVIGTIAAWRGIRRMTAPRDDLVAASEQIERGDYSAQVQESGPRPMRTLGRAFNKMSSRLAEQDERRRTFLADVAHELRTPLSVIEAQLEAIEDGIYPADREHLAPIREQAQALEKLVDDVRTVALADAGSLTLDRQPIELDALLRDSVASFEPRAAAAGVTLATELPTSLPPVSLDAPRIRQVLANLIGNALRYTPAGGRVTVSASVAGRPQSAIEVAVTDSGPGIAPQLLPRVFERFVKGADSAGTGLGLAIAHDLVQAHGGTIKAESRPGSGTTIRFTLPI